MKTEQEIVLQKKMIIIFFLVIFTFTMGIINIHKDTVLAASKDDEIIIRHTNYIANEELFKIEVSGDIFSNEIESGDNSGDSTEFEESGESIAQDAVVSRGSYIRETNVPPTDYEKVIEVKATAYCLCKKCTGKTPSNSGYGHTASGYVITPGNEEKVIAVDPKIIPLGTKVYVDGYGYAIAADTGSAIKGNKIDVYKDTHQLALQWGIKKVNVYILKEEL